MYPLKLVDVKRNATDIRRQTLNFSKDQQSAEVIQLRPHSKVFGVVCILKASCCAMKTTIGTRKCKLLYEHETSCCCKAKQGLAPLSLTQAGSGTCVANLLLRQTAWPEVGLGRGLARVLLRPIWKWPSWPGAGQQFWLPWPSACAMPLSVAPNAD